MQRLHPIPVLVCGALLSACAHASEAPFIRQSGVQPEPKQLAADQSACRGRSASAGDVLGGAAGGLAGGAYVGTAYGASTGGPLGAAGGFVLGSAIGLAGGVYDALPDDHYEFCMARKGYQRADAEPAEIVEARLQPAR